MRHIFYILACTMLICLSACKEDSDSQLILSTNHLTFSPNGGSQTIDIESNTDWKIVSDVSWLSVYPSTGSLNKTITVTAAIKDSELEQETKIVISTKDGAKVVNVSVKVEGSEVKSGKYLEVKGGDKELNGKAGSTETLAVTSNITWEVLGPEWIEIWDGERWRPMSPDRGVVKYVDSQIITFRAIADNKDEDRLSGVVVVREYLTGEYTHTVNIAQLGRMEVSPTILQTLQDGAVFDWHCGCDVEKIWFKVTDDMDYDLLSDFVNNVIRGSWQETNVTYINSAVNLKPDTKIKVFAIGEDAQGNLSGETGSCISYTEKADASVGVEFGFARYMDDGRWQFYINKGQNTDDFSLYATDSQNSAFMYNDPILWYIANETLDRQEWFKLWYVIEYGWIEFGNLSENPKELHAMTWSYGTDGMVCTKVFRYDRYYDDDGKRLPDKPLLDRIPKAMIDDSRLR